jgi:hypothetical protein
MLMPQAQRGLRPQRPFWDRQASGGESPPFLAPNPEEAFCVFLLHHLVCLLIFLIKISSTSSCFRRGISYKYS